MNINKTNSDHNNYDKSTTSPFNNDNTTLHISDINRDNLNTTDIDKNNIKTINIQRSNITKDNIKPNNTKGSNISKNYISQKNIKKMNTTRRKRRRKKARKNHSGKSRSRFIILFTLFLLAVTTSAVFLISSFRNKSLKTFSPLNIPVSGWVEENGKKYYYEKGEKIKGWFLEDDARGTAPRRLYEKFGFIPGEMCEELGCPQQQFIRFGIGGDGR